MIKKDEYYKSVYGRANNFKKALRQFFFYQSSTARMLIENVLHYDMGIRYFSLSQSIRMLVILVVLPFIIPVNYGLSWYHTILSNWAWYGYLIAFAKCSWDRHKECRKPHGYFDFDHFSLSTGKKHSKLEALRLKHSWINARTLDIYIEPLLATAVGLLALLLGQWLLSLLLILSGGIYSMSYKAAYDMGRDYLLDVIDDALCGKNIAESMLNDVPATTNFQFFGPKPSTEEARKGLADLIGDDDNGVNVE